jgi:integrase
MPRPNRGPYLKFLKHRGAFYIHWSEHGATRQRSTGTADSGEAEAALAAFIQERRSSKRAGPRDPGEFPVADALTGYGEEHAPTKADPLRIAYAIQALVPYWSGMMVGDITKATCRGYVRYRDKAPGTVRRELIALQAAVNYAKDEGRIMWAPTVHLPTKPDGKDRWLTRSEAAALLSAARTGHPSTRGYLPLFILIGLYCGARKGAILSLRWPQVDLVNGRINFNEPGRERTSKGRAHLPIPRRLLFFLRKARERGSDLGYVLHRDGQRIANIKRAFNAACVDAGLAEVCMVTKIVDGEKQKVPRLNAKGEPVMTHTITPHVLRHTCGTWLAQAAVPLDKIGEWLGHTDSRTTRLYAHHHPDHMNEALNAFDRRRA